MDKIILLVASILIRVFKNDNIRAWAIKQSLKAVNKKIKKAAKNKKNKKGK